MTRKTSGLTILLLAALLVAGLAGCAGVQRDAERPEEEGPVVFGQVRVAEENLRAAPNGRKIGEALRGDQFPVVLRRGNWVQLDHPDLGEAWIWAPSLGYDSLNPMDVHMWLGTGSAPLPLDSLTIRFGPPMGVEPFGGAAVRYIYNNRTFGGGTTFGTYAFEAVHATIDRGTRSVVAVEFVLPPFEGKSGELLPALGLHAAKSTNTNFDRARYDDRFKGISRVDLVFEQSNFERIATARAWRYNPERWRDYVDVNEQKVTIGDNDQLVLEMWVTNRDESRAYAGPQAELELRIGGQSLGTWSLGPGDVRVGPGEKKMFRLAIPLKASRVDVKQVAARAELTDMLVLPAGGGS